MILPLDLTEVVEADLDESNRAWDGKLHPSGDLAGSLRHTQLSVAGAPRKPEPLVRRIRLMTGTMWHERLHNRLRSLGVPYMAEVNLTPWLPEGWAGTADAVVWNPEHKAFVLVDFKTTKGSSIQYVVRDGAKTEHILQASAYWYALKKMGLPMLKAIGVFYLPIDDVRGKEPPQPQLIDFDPLPAKELRELMAGRHQRTTEYVASLPHGLPPGVEAAEAYLTDALESEQPRLQRCYFDRKTETYELKLIPHWSAEFCPYEPPLCSCSEQGTTKLGIFEEDGTYHARPGFEDIEPEAFPS